MRPTGTPVEEFLAGVTPAARREDARTLIALMSRLTGEPPAMWGPSIIGFGALRLTYASGRRVDVPILGFSPRASAQSIYLTVGFDRHRDLLDRLGKHREAKSCLYLTRLANIDLDVLEQLLVRSRDEVLAAGESPSSP